MKFFTIQVTIPKPGLHVRHIQVSDCIPPGFEPVMEVDKRDQNMVRRVFRLWNRLLKLQAQDCMVCTKVPGSDRWRVCVRSWSSAPGCNSGQCYGVFVAERRRWRKRARLPHARAS